MKNTELMLKEWRYLRGKRIEKVRESVSDGVCLHFKDGTFCVFAGQGDYEGNNAVSLYYDFTELSFDDLHEFELVTDEEFEEHEARQQAKWEAEEKINRRQQYKKLKEEFEGEE